MRPETHIVSVLTPVADAFAGGVDTDIVCLRDYTGVRFVFHVGAIEDAGISNIVTVKACTSAAGAGATAMAFRYRYVDYTTAVDVPSAWTAATSSGFDFAAAIAGTAGGHLWEIEVLAQDVSAAVADAEFVYCSIAETANKTLLAGCTAQMFGPKYVGATDKTAIA